MNAPPYQKLFWGSYHKHTSHLRHASEHGAYLLLIGALWNNGGRLAADDDTLAGYAKLSVEEWVAIKPKLLMPHLLKIVRGKLVQARVTEDLAKYRDTSGKRSEAGKAGGLASAGKGRENRTAIAAPLPTKPEPEPEPKKASEDKSSALADPSATAWELAKALLTERGGATAKAAGSFFGGLLAKHRIEARELLPALAQAHVSETRDPQSYLTRAAEGVAKRKADFAQPRLVGFV